jgi:hypothetical protein
MIVNNTGYINLEQVLEMAKNKEPFYLYETKKKTVVLLKHILSIGTATETLNFYMPKEDRLPWKLIEGKKITSGIKIFSSLTDDVNTIDTTKWNNGNQIMSYEEYSNY